MERKLWLDPIPEALRDQAAQALQAGDADGFLCAAGNHHGLDLVLHNMAVLKQLGLYERATLRAFIGTSANNAGWTQRDLIGFFNIGNRERFLAAGDPLPGLGPFTLYRGVAGGGAQRRERGLSWTSELDLAWWFAYRAAGWGLPNPGVVTATVAAEHVIACMHSSEVGRGENEFIVLLPKGTRLIHRPASEGRECADRYERLKNEQQRQWIATMQRKLNEP